jgi:hypothetical protein
MKFRYGVGILGLGILNLVIFSTNLSLWPWALISLWVGLITTSHGMIILVKLLFKRLEELVSPEHDK